MFKALSKLFLALALITPLISSSSLYAPFMSGKAVFFRLVIELAILFFAAHLLVSRTKSQEWQEVKRRVKQPLVIALSAFAVVFMLSAFMGVNPSVSFWSNFIRGEGAFLLLHCLVFCILAITLFPTRKQFEKLLWVHVGVSLVVCLYGVAQLSTVALSQLGGRIMSTLGNPSYLAGYLLLTIPFLIYFLIRSTSRLSLLFWIGAILLEVYVLLLTQTRAALLALLVGIVIVVVLNLFRAGSFKRRAWLGGILAVGVALGGLFIATHQANFWKQVPLIKRATDLQLVAREFAPRLWTWNSAIAGFLDRPILGWGAENFYYPFDRYYDPRHFVMPPAPIEEGALVRQYYFGGFDRAHNIFLEYLIIGGVVLFAAWLTVFIIYYHELLRRKKDFWFSVLFAVPLVHLTQGFFFFDTLTMYLGLCVLFAFFINSGSEEWEKEPAGNTPYIWSGLSLIKIAVLIIVALVLINKSVVAPYKKAQLLVTAVNTALPSKAFEAHLQALRAPSAIGQKEAVDELAKFELLLFETAAQQGDASAIPVEQVRMLVDTYGEWYEKASGALLGEESAYLAGAVFIEAGLAFDQGDYLARGKHLYEQALVRAPKRLEFVRALMRVAKIEGDSVAYQRYLALAQGLRPDLAWE